MKRIVARIDHLCDGCLDIIGKGDACYRRGKNLLCRRCAVKIETHREAQARLIPLRHREPTNSRNVVLTDNEWRQRNRNVTP